MSQILPEKDEDSRIAEKPKGNSASSTTSSKQGNARTRSLTIKDPLGAGTLQ